MNIHYAHKQELKLPDPLDSDNSDEEHYISLAQDTYRN